MAKCTIQVKGNLARDVETKYSKAGKAYSVLSVGSTPSKKVNGEWENGETMWFNVTVFAELNPFEFKKGMPVEVEGTLNKVWHYNKKTGGIGVTLDVTADGDKIKAVPKTGSTSPNAIQAKDNWNAPKGWSEIPATVLEDAPF